MVDIGVCAAGGWLRKPGETEVQADNRIKRDIAGMADTGFKWLRWGWDWTSVEQKPGVYILDRRVKIAGWVRDAGMKSLVVTGYTPSFYRRKGVTTPYSPPAPEHYDAWGRYYSAVVSAGSSVGVKRYGHWNESNHHPFWDYPSTEVQAAMLAEAKKAARAADPYARIVLGEMSPARTKKDAAGRYVEINPVEYVQSWYSDPARKPLVDAWSFHPYKVGDPHEVVPWSLMTVQYDAIRNVLAEHGHENRKTWGTEFGHTTRPNDAGGRPQVSEAVQAELIVEQIEMWRTLPGAGPGFLFNWQEFPTGDGRVNGLGIVRLDGSYKPSRQAVKELLT